MSFFAQLGDKTVRREQASMRRQREHTKPFRKAIQTIRPTAASHAAPFRAAVSRIPK